MIGARSLRCEVPRIRQAPSKPSSVVPLGRLRGKPHLIGRQDGGVLMFEATLLQFGHWVAGDDFEVVAAKVEKAPRDAPVVVDRGW